MSRTTASATVGQTTLSFETGHADKQADGSIWARLGDTVVLVAVVGAKLPMPGKDFFPLQVEYRERSAAAGRIPGGWFKREGRAHTREILTSRLIDRPVRPLFPDGFFNEVQIAATVFSSDQENDSDVLAVSATSAALYISDIPFETPFGCVRIGRINGEFVVNPTYQQQEQSSLDIVVCASRKAVIMVEGGAKELERALDGLCRRASLAINSGYTIIILSDRMMDRDNAAIPALLATSAVHQHLVTQGLRTRVGLVVETGSARETHHFAVLAGFGAEVHRLRADTDLYGLVSELCRLFLHQQLHHGVHGVLQNSHGLVR